MRGRAPRRKRGGTNDFSLAGNSAEDTFDLSFFDCFCHRNSLFSQRCGEGERAASGHETQRGPPETMQEEGKEA